MPAMVRIGPNPAFKPADEAEKKAFEFAKGKGPFETDYVNAMEDMTNDELKQMMLVAGVTPQKQMKRPEIIKAIRLSMERVEIIDEETDAQT